MVISGIMIGMGLNKKNQTSFKKGHEPWNKGFKGWRSYSHTKETRDKMSKIAKIKGRKPPIMPQVRVEVECQNCNEKYEVVPSRLNNTKYCSLQCKGKAEAATKKEHFSPEIRAKAAEANRNRLLGKTGSLALNWQGGKTKENDIVRKSQEYKDWRTSVFERDNYTCTWCGDNRGGNLQADHIKPFAHFVELRFDIDNGRTLCKECHKTTDTYLEKTRYKNYVTN